RLVQLCHRCPCAKGSCQVCAGSLARSCPYTGGMFGLEWVCEQTPLNSPPHEPQQVQPSCVVSRRTCRPGSSRLLSLPAGSDLSRGSFPTTACSSTSKSGHTRPLS